MAAEPASAAEDEALQADIAALHGRLTDIRELHREVCRCCSGRPEKGRQRKSLGSKSHDGTDCAKVEDRRPGLPAEGEPPKRPKFARRCDTSARWRQ